MRTIEWTSRFKKDYRREHKGSRGDKLDRELREVLGCLVDDRPLPARQRDHALVGRWKGFRDCHVRPDLVLIYETCETDVLRLVRLGSHAELGL